MISGLVGHLVRQQVLLLLYFRFLDVTDARKYSSHSDGSLYTRTAYQCKTEATSGLPSGLPKLLRRMFLRLCYAARIRYMHRTPSGM